jgi:hypothetical protein
MQNDNLYVFDCETWFVALGKHRLNVFEKRVLKEYLEPRERKQ